MWPYISGKMGQRINTQKVHRNSKAIFLQRFQIIFKNTPFVQINMAEHWSKIVLIFKLIVSYATLSNGKK
jgi:hypothetical protein